MSSINCVRPASLSGFLLKTYSRCKSAQILKITECTGVRENQMCDCDTVFLASCIAIKKCAKWCSFCKNRLRKSAFSRDLPGGCCDGIWSLSSLCIGDGHRRWSPSNCCPSLWRRKVASCTRENLESRTVGTIHFPLAHPCCSQCKVSTAGLLRNTDGPKSPFHHDCTPTMQMVFCSTEDLTKSSAGVIWKCLATLLLYLFIKRTKGMQVGELGHVWVICPFACRGEGPAFGSVKPDTKQNVALHIFSADRPGRTLFSSCDRDFPVPGIAL